MLLLLAIALTSCHFHQDQFVDFSDLEATKGLKFQVISQTETDLSDGLPYNCFLPDGTPIAEYVENETSYAEGGPLHAPQTSSVTGTAIVQELLKYGNQNRVIEIVGTYPSFDGEWNEVTLSGKVMLPKGRKPKRLILVSKDDIDVLLDQLLQESMVLVNHIIGRQVERHHTSGLFGQTDGFL